MLLNRRKLLMTVAAAVVAVPALARAQAPAAAPAAPARLNPNTASAAELAAVPGLAAPLADAIVKQRPFPTMVAFDKLVRQTLSADQAKALYAQLFIPINLNTATTAEIALIPGMSQRMIGEFMEYRPYKAIDTFNREIGKYVDATEVARLRSYVTL
jgi:DNA uptake protein ComE-like DNA-binding protein